MMPIVWATLGVVILAAAMRCHRSPRALKLGMRAVALLYIGAGALVNAYFLARGEDYEGFADGAYISFVRETWRSLVLPNHELFISALIVFELAVGLLVLRGGWQATLGLVGAIGFHVGLLAFGWGFYLWAVPMLVALGLLLRAHRQVAAPSDEGLPFLTASRKAA